MRVVLIGQNEIIRKSKRIYNIITSKANNAVYQCANSMARELRNAAKARGHVATGRLTNPNTGFRVKKIKRNEYAIVAPYYLKMLETGTTPHIIPWHNKQIRAGTRYFGGKKAYLLKETIAKVGTKPHYFVTRTINQYIKKTNEKARTVFGDTYKRS